MEAKDTVMKYEQAEAFDNKVEKKYKESKGYRGIDWAYTYEDRQALKSKMKWGKLEAQAEISFKAGGKQGYDKGVIDRLREIDALIARLKTVKQAGIREVVEFIEQWALRANYQADPSKECWGISDEELAKLKERGIE